MGSGGCPGLGPGGLGPAMSSGMGGIGGVCLEKLFDRVDALLPRSKDTSFRAGVGVLVSELADSQRCTRFAQLKFMDAVAQNVAKLFLPPSAESLTENDLRKATCAKRLMQGDLRSRKVLRASLLSKVCDVAYAE